MSVVEIHFQKNKNFNLFSNINRENGYKSYNIDKVVKILKYMKI